MAASRSVLVVDQSDETREVLRTVLQRRGLSILEARAAQQGIDMARKHQPDLIVLDLETESCESDDSPLDFDGPDGQPRPVILLGTARRQAARLPGAEFVSKPYHYGPLIRRIEELLESTR